MKLAQQREEELKKERDGIQSLTDSMKVMEADMEKKAQEHKEERQRLLKEHGISGVDDIEDAHKLPHMLNMNPDKSLEGCLKIFLREGETLIGADRTKCQVFLHGLDVAGEVCVICNEANEELEVRPCPGGLVRVNGRHVEKNGHLLQSGDRLAIGRAHIFKVVIPASASEENEKEEDFEEALNELQKNSKVDRGINAAVTMVQREYGTEQANFLLEKAKRANEVVGDANALLKSIPQAWNKEVSHYELAVLFEAHGPEVCVIARPKAGARTVMQGTPQAPGISLGIWEARRFEDRFDSMLEAQELIMERKSFRASSRDFLGTVQDAVKPGDWELHVWSEVPLDCLRQLKKADEARKKELDEQKKDFNIWHWFTGKKEERKEEHEEKKDDKCEEGQQNVWLRTFTQLIGLSNKSEREEDQTAKSKAAPPKVQARKQEASRSSSAARPRRTLLPGHLQVPEMSPKRSSSTSSMGRASVASANPPSPTGKWVPPEDLLAEKFGGDIHVDPGRLEAGSIRRASKTGIETVAQDLLVPVEDGRQTVQIEVKELFGDKLGVRLRMENLVVSNFDVPEAADVGWRFGDEIVAVNGKAVASREDFRHVLAEARQRLPIVFTVKRQIRVDVGRRTISGHKEAGKEKGRKKRATSTSVPYRIMDTE
ncbi:unnamed protein product [Durusdinium trenchii]|uniref:PDZ domain-containing protein n=1 Tax=Durusdinium trenchii TaxID=1381693 RepID=A0ABP0H817_9DINO